MSYQQALTVALGLMVLCSSLVQTRANPVMTSEVNTDPNTEMATELPRDRNPIYNVWEYAYIHDGSNANQDPVGTRNGEAPQGMPHGVLADAPPVMADAPVQEEEQGSPCLWAIVSCCDAETNYERDNCFEALGCEGAWFQNLCSDEYISAANNRVNSLFLGGFSKK